MCSTGKNQTNTLVLTAQSTREGPCTHSQVILEVLCEASFVVFLIPKIPNLFYTELFSETLTRWIAVKGKGRKGSTENIGKKFLGKTNF